jgi:hypothetical protein
MTQEAKATDQCGRFDFTESKAGRAAFRLGRHLFGAAGEAKRDTGQFVRAAHYAGATQPAIATTLIEYPLASKVTPPVWATHGTDETHGEYESLPAYEETVRLSSQRRRVASGRPAPSERPTAQSPDGETRPAGACEGCRS